MVWHGSPVAVQNKILPRGTPCVLVAYATITVKSTNGPPHSTLLSALSILLTCSAPPAFYFLVAVLAQSTGPVEDATPPAFYANAATWP
jgi:hypothetical protein